MPPGYLERGTFQYRADHIAVLAACSAHSVSSRVERLDEAARQEEIARMLGGKKITGTTRAHAAELLEASRR